MNQLDALKQYSTVVADTGDADAIERGAELEVEQLLSALNENQLESLRLESQEALIDGFGVMSGRVKGPSAR